MKLSKSKLALAKVINENGGWVDGAKWSAQDKRHCEKINVVAFYMKGKPWRNGGDFWRGNDVHGEKIYANELIRNWHQTILSREEYYQAYPKADAEFCESVTRSIPETESNEKLSPDAVEAAKIALMSESIEGLKRKPTIEQLAADYRNKLDYANRKRQEADDAKTAADAALGELVKAGDELGLVIGVAKSEPGLAITKRHQLKLGDVIWIGNSGRADKDLSMPAGEYTVVKVGTIGVLNNGATFYPDFSERNWRFIRRP